MLLLYPDKKLTTPCFDWEPRDLSRAFGLAHRLKEIRQKIHAPGIAANQIGLNIRMLAFDPLKVTIPSVILRPFIKEFSSDFISTFEGCQSLPNQMIKTKRYKTITVNYLDLYGKEEEITVTDFSSVCMQHEIDHLNGIMIFQRKFES